MIIREIWVLVRCCCVSLLEHVGTGTMRISVTVIQSESGSAWLSGLGYQLCHDTCCSMDLLGVADCCFGLGANLTTTFTTALQNAGYITMMAGKDHLLLGKVWTSQDGVLVSFPSVSGKQMCVKATPRYAQDSACSIHKAFANATAMLCSCKLIVYFATPYETISVTRLPVVLFATLNAACLWATSAVEHAGRRCLFFNGSEEDSVFG